ncbi:MAG: hypothetical protein ACD_46C00298G0003 [uncultured bacterium]|nr:MAG: hypothetical protein ACD_46C00298G0003 [uncultured bacterium]
MRRLLLLLVVEILCVFSCVSFAEEAAPANPLALSTTGFLDQGTMPVVYTCDGKDMSPQFSWTGAPPKTQSLAFIVSDPTAPSGTFYHWVLYNIPTSVIEFPEGMDKVPAGVQVGKNSWNKARYNGPCPPKGSAHTYTFTLYALDTKLSVPAGADGKTVTNALAKHIIGKIEITAVYSRWLS